MFRKILLLLDDGNYPSRVARLLHLSPQRVAYHVKKAQKLGILRRLNEGGWLSFYEVAPTFKKSLTGGENLAYKGVRLHAYSLKFPVVVEPSVVVDWDRVRLANWTRLVGCECGLTVEKTTKHVIIHADEVLSADSNEATLVAILECLRVARILEEKFRMRLGTPKLLRKPHYGVYDPVASVFANYMEVSDDVGKIDKSEGVGEIDFYSAEHAKEYLLMPFRLQQIERRLQRLESGLTTILQTWNLVGNNLLDLLTKLQQNSGVQALANKEVVFNG